MKVDVEHRVCVAVSGPSDPVAIDLKAEFTHENPAYQTWKTFRMGGPPPKKIETWATEGRGKYVTVPRGGFERVIEILRRHGHEPEVVNHTVSVPAKFDERFSARFWEHQNRLINGFIHADEKGFVNGLWRAPQGSGKTQAVLGAIVAVEQRTLIVVSTSALFDQWAQRIRRELNTEPGVIQGKRRDVRNVTIGMAQTLAKCADDYADAFGFVVLDESQNAAAATMQSVMDTFSARYRLGVSGDERRADRKEFLTYDIFGPVTCEVTREQVQKTGEVVDVEIRVVPTDFRADWYVALGADDPSDERQRIQAAREKVHYRARLLEELTSNFDRNRLIVDTALAASEYYGPGASQFVVLSDRREQCHRLESMLTARGVKAGLFIGGADYASQFDVTLAGMRDGSVTAGVGTYQAIGVGFEAHRELAIGVCASPCVHNEKSRMQFNQYRGRFARSAPGKERGVLYYLWDRHVYGMNPVRLLCRWNDTVKVKTPSGWVDGKRFLKDA